MQYEAMMKEKAKSDMIGGIYHTNLIDIVSDEFNSAEEKKSWEAFTEAMRLCMEGMNGGVR